MMTPEFCRQNVFGSCLYGSNCIYRHIPLADMLMMSDTNKGIMPCKFVTSKVGCSMKVIKHYKIVNTIKCISCEKDKMRNHFFKPQYICSDFLYKSSIDKNLTYCNIARCPHLHISWRNFNNNLFKSHLDTDHKLSIEFLVGIIKNLVYNEEKRQFDILMINHNRAMDLYKEQYWSKCIICSLPPYKHQIAKPKVFTVMALSRHICRDLALIISQFMYKRHSECRYIKRDSLSNESSVIIMKQTDLSLHGKRVVPTDKSISINDRHVHLVEKGIVFDDLCDIAQERILSLLFN